MADSLTVDGTLYYDRILRHFIIGGNCAVLGPYAVVVLLAIQASAAQRTGVADVSVKRLSDLTSVSPTGIHRALDVLKAAEYIESLPSEPGKKARYMVKRWIVARDQTGAEVPVCWSYIPEKESERIDEVKTFIKTGVQPIDASIHIHLHVDQLQVVHQGGVGIQIQNKDADDIQAAQAWWKSLHPSQWNQVLLAAGLHIAGKPSDAAITTAWRAAIAPDGDDK